MSTLEKRLEVLEASFGGDGGCERCRGLLVTVRHAITGGHHSATWNGEAISEGELLERRAEARCPRCSRELDHGGASVIKLGVRRSCSAHQRREDTWQSRCQKYRKRGSGKR